MHNVCATSLTGFTEQIKVREAKAKSINALFQCSNIYCIQLHNCKGFVRDNKQNKCFILGHHLPT